LRNENRTRDLRNKEQDANHSVYCDSLLWAYFFLLDTRSEHFSRKTWWEEILWNTLADGIWILSWWVSVVVKEADWIHLAQHREQWRALVNTVVKLLVLYGSIVHYHQPDTERIEQAYAVCRGAEVRFEQRSVTVVLIIQRGLRAAFTCWRGASEGSLQTWVPSVPIFILGGHFICIWHVKPLEPIRKLSILSRWNPAYKAVRGNIMQVGDVCLVLRDVSRSSIGQDTDCPVTSRLAGLSWYYADVTIQKHSLPIWPVHLTKSR
jgi:hypothetical protein